MRIPVPDRVPPAEQLGRVHFVGIGGAGLSAIARIMLERGIPVAGSDGRDSPLLRSLEAAGARVHVGHDAQHLRDADTVVASTAVREDNPEVVAAGERGLRLLPRSGGLASLLQGRRAVAVAGTHGKTTTTSLLVSALLATGADPSYAVGAELTGTGPSAHAGADDVFVVEADESDGAFLHYAPYAAVVTNVEADHLDVWGTEAAYRAAFEEFVGTLDPDGFLVCCVDDEGARALAEWARGQGRRVVTVGESPDARWRALDLAFEDTTSSFTLVEDPQGDAQDHGRVLLRIPGRHYVLDAVAAIAAGAELGHRVSSLVEGLSGFTGASRRMEAKGEASGVRVYDSYAHHPVEIAGDLQAARAVAGSGRLIVGFQPHLVSRTRVFGAAMGEALGAADEVVVCDVYLAREDPDPEVTGRLVADAVPLPADRVAFHPDLADVAGALAARARPGDLVLTLGAGDVTTVAPRVLELLEARDG